MKIIIGRAEERLGDFVDGGGQAGNAPTSIAPVQHLLASGLVQHLGRCSQGLSGLLDIAIRNSLAHGLHDVLYAGLDRLVAGIGLEALTVALERRLVVGHNLLLTLTGRPHHGA